MGVVGLFTRTVDVLTADLNSVEIDESLLSVTELGRALEYAMTPDLRPYLAAQTWVRRRLSEYLDCSPDEIELRCDESGRTRVVWPETELTFDLSYSGAIIALAVGFRVSVGVAVEALDEAKVDTEKVRRVLNRPEADSVFSSPDLRKEFLRLWSRKQAITSAIGTDPSDRNVLGLSPVVLNGFEITDINLGEGIKAAVAVPEGCTLQITLVDLGARSNAKLAVAV